MHKDVTGAILTGGESRRMGRDKATLEFNGEPLVKKAVRLFGELFPHVLVVNKAPGSFGDLGCEEVADLFAERGAMVGVLTALAAAKTGYVFVAACDMPFLKRELIELILSKDRRFSVVLPRIGGKGDPLHAFYAKSCYDAMRIFMNEEGKSLNAFIGSLPPEEVGYVSEEEIRGVDPEAIALFNMNTPDDYEKAKKIY